MGYTPKQKGIDGEGTRDVFLVNKVFRAKCTKPVYYYYGTVNKPGDSYWLSYSLKPDLEKPDQKILVDHGIVTPVDCFFRGYSGIVRTTKGAGKLEILVYKISAENNYTGEAEPVLVDDFDLNNSVNPNLVKSKGIVELVAGDVIMLYVRRVLRIGFLGWSRHVHGTISLIFERK